MTNSMTKEAKTATFSKAAANFHLKNQWLGKPWRPQGHLTHVVLTQVSDAFGAGMANGIAKFFRWQIVKNHCLINATVKDNLFLMVK